MLGPPLHWPNNQLHVARVARRVLAWLRLPNGNGCWGNFSKAGWGGHSNSSCCMEIVPTLFFYPKSFGFTSEIVTACQTASM